MPLELSSKCALRGYGSPPFCSRLAGQLSKAYRDRGSTSAQFDEPIESIRVADFPGLRLGPLWGKLGPVLVSRNPPGLRQAAEQRPLAQTCTKCDIGHGLSHPLPGLDQVLYLDDRLSLFLSRLLMLHARLLRVFRAERLRVLGRPPKDSPRAPLGRSLGHCACHPDDDRLCGAACSGGGRFGGLARVASYGAPAREHPAGLS